MTQRTFLDKILYCAIILACCMFLIHSKVVVPHEQQQAIQDYFTQDVVQDNEQGFNMKLKPIGVLSIPSINLELMIYNNASEDAINHGAGLIQGSGNLHHEHDNSILTAHNGDPLNDLFINVPKLKIGDKFYIKQKDGTIDSYSVTDTQTVDPTDELIHYKKSDGDTSYVTLRTCVPIGINSQRFLATGEYQGEVENIEENPQFTFSLVDSILIVVILVDTGLLIRSFIFDKKVSKS